MGELSAADIVSMIVHLGTREAYHYYRRKTKIRISHITRPEGPIKFTRWESHQDESRATSGAISANQLRTASSVFSRRPNYPIHFDRLFSGGGNSRSALETLLAHTPHFFICYPERTNVYTGRTDRNLKHIMWCPGATHPPGQIHTKDYQQIISEVELDLDFGNIGLASLALGQEFDSIETKKIHTQMQVALVRIGKALAFHTWIARNDRAITVAHTTLGELDGVIPSLDDVRILYNQESKKAASLIDCIWFSADFKYIPAVIEVEHTTGVAPGLTRMLKLKETVPSISATYTIVAPNDIRNRVVAEANNPAFRALRARYMAYSTVRELYGLIQRYRLSKSVDRTFIEPFMEPVVENEP